MSNLFSELKDFQLVEKENGGDMAYRFRIGKCDDFAEMMKLFKRAISLQERVPNQEKNWLWEVKASRANFIALDTLFDNFGQCYEIAKSQMKMFPASHKSREL